MPQIIKIYIRGHSFAMREKNIEQWCKELEHIPEDVRGVIHPTHTSTHIPLGLHPPNLPIKLQGRIDSNDIYNLETLAAHYDLPDLQTLTSQYLFSSIFKSSSDLAHLINAPLEAFRKLRVPVEAFDHDRYILHDLRCTGPDPFRNGEGRHD